jgi:PAS domain S-box-containing protein
MVEENFLTFSDEEKKIMQKYFDFLNALVVVLDKEGKVIFVNKKVAEVLGYKEEEILGKDWFLNFIDEKERERVKKAHQELILGKIAPNEHVINFVVTKEKKKRLISWHNTVVFNQDKDIFATFSVGEDITEEKEKEEALRQKTEELERLNKLLVGRELKMIELKDQLKKLQEKLNES